MVRSDQSGLRAGQSLSEQAIEGGGACSVGWT